MNVMSEPWFDPEHYRSDSNQHWRHGCPHDDARARRLRVAAAPDAPRDLGLRRRDDGRDDAHVPRRRPRRAPRASARRPDRPRMKPLTVIVTASGAPGHRSAPPRAARERRARDPARRHRHERALDRPAPLRRVPPRPRRLRPGLSGRDPRHRRARGRSGGPAAVVVRPRRARRRDRRLRRRRRPRLAARRDPPLERQGRELRLPAPPRASPRPISGASRARPQVEAAARELGYPDRPVCFKPVFSSGSRGFRILDPTVDRADQLLRERPGSVSMRLEEAVEILASVDDQTDLLVMELATGPERTIDGIANGSRDRPRPPEDPRGDARRPRDVLRHARGRGA